MGVIVAFSNCNAVYFNAFHLNFTDTSISKTAVCYAKEREKLFISLDSTALYKQKRGLIFPTLKINPLYVHSIRK